MFRESAREFFKREIRPHSERWREAGIVDREAFRKAGEAGLLLIWVREKYGGLGLPDFRYEQILIEENAWHGDPCFFSTLHSRLVAPTWATSAPTSRKRASCRASPRVSRSSQSR